jgi:hypothetical protein
MTELGPDPSLAEFGIEAMIKKEYKARTLKNVVDGDGTVIYGDLTGGTKLTVEYCVQMNKPYVVNPTPKDLMAFVRDNRIQVLNVAGNRGSKLTPERLEGYRKQFQEGLQMIMVPV